VSASRIDDSSKANVFLSIEFIGGIGPFKITGDGIDVVQIVDVKGYFFDAGVTYKYVHFESKAVCDGMIVGTVQMEDAVSKQVKDYKYYISGIKCDA